MKNLVEIAKYCNVDIKQDSIGTNTVTIEPYNVLKFGFIRASFTNKDLFFAIKEAFDYLRLK